MPAEMTSRERMLAVYAHATPDRVPITESPWSSTIARWRAEGLPAGVSVADHFGLEKQYGIHPDNSPRYPVQVLEETPEYRVHTTAWGTTCKDWKDHGGVPQYLGFTIKDRDSWAEAKRRMTPTEDRINWDRLARDYPKARAQGALIVASGWFGYDITASRISGTNEILMAMVEDPDWCQDMFHHQLGVLLDLLEMAWKRGYTFDVFSFPDDLGYRNGLFFSLRLYRDVVKPVQRRVAEWCHDRGVKVMMHSCGNIMELVPDLVDAGIDGLNPLEQKAGMDAYALKRDFGDELVLMGGVDVRKWVNAEDLEAETVAKLEALKQGSGYIFHSDHSVPENVSYANYRRVVELVREHGRYD